MKKKLFALQSRHPLNDIDLLLKILYVSKSGSIRNLLSSCTSLHDIKILVPLLSQALTRHQPYDHQEQCLYVSRSKVEPLSPSDKHELQRQFEPFSISDTVDKQIPALEQQTIIRQYHLFFLIGYTYTSKFKTFLEDIHKYIDTQISQKKTALFILINDPPKTEKKDEEDHVQKVIDMLIENPILILSKDEINCTPLHLAAYRGHMQILNTFMHMGADVHFNSNKGTALHSAAIANVENTKVTQALIKANAKVNETNLMGSTPLFQAVSKGKVDTVKILLHAGANISTALTGGNYIGETALHKAAKKGHISITNSLIEAKADVMARDQYGNTPLHLAAEDGHENIIEALLQAGADPHAQTKLGETALQLAINAHHWPSAVILQEVDEKPKQTLCSFFCYEYLNSFLIS